MSESDEICALLRDKSKALNKKNYREAANTCNCLGHKYAELDDFEEAIKQHKEELVFCEKLKDRLGMAVAHRNIGECLSMTGAFKTALSHLKEYVHIALELINKPEIQRAEATFGRTYWLHFNADPEKNASSLSKAENHFRNSLRWAERLKGEVADVEYAQMKCRALINLALVFDHKNDSRQCVEFYKQSFVIAETYKFKDDLNRCVMAWANYYQRTGEYDKAKDLYDAAVKSCKELNDKNCLCEAFLSKANALVYLSDYDGARHYYKRAYHLRSSDDELRAKSIAGCKAMKKVVQTLKIINLGEDLEEKCKLYDNLGDSFVDINCYKVAITYYKKELDCAIKLNKSKDELAVIYVSLGQTYLDNDQPNEALESFYKELECRKDVLEEEVKTILKIIEVKIKLCRSFDEIEQEYEYLIIKCASSDQLMKTVLKDYCYYLESLPSSNQSTKLKEIRDQLLNLDSSVLPSQDNRFLEDEEMNESHSEVSDLTDNSDDDNDGEETAGKVSRVRRTNKKSEFKVNEKGETPLHVACIAGDLNRVEKLIEMGHPVNPRDNAGWLPIHEAANHGHTEIVQYLIDHGANFNDRGGDLCGGTTPLHDACVNGNSSVIRVLIRSNANVIRCDEDGNTPLDCLKSYYEREEDSLSSEERKDYQLLIDELTEKMKASGFDFSVKGTKRSHSSRSQAFEQPVNNLRRGDNDVDISSPPRKVRANERRKNRENNTDHGAKEYKNEIARLRGEKKSNPLPMVDERRKIRSLINEDDAVFDAWLEKDVNTSTRKSKPVGDPFKGARSSRQSTNNARLFNQKKDFIKNRTKDLHQIKDTVLMSDGGLSDQESENGSISPPDLIDDHGNDDSIELITNLHVTNKNRASKCSSIASSKSRSESVHQQDHSDTVTGPPCSNLILGMTSSNLPQNTEKILVKVHINGKTLLMPVPGKLCTVGWLADQSAERYAKNWQLKPVITLTDKDGAILGSDDLVTDVVVEKEVYADIQSWLIDPLHDRYEVQCKAKSIKCYSDVLTKLKIADSSGSLTLKNVKLGKIHSQAILCALKHQTNLRNLDISFSDILLNDSSNEFAEVLTTTKNINELDLRGTGINRSKLISLDYKHLSKLNTLNISYNHLSDDSLDFILNSIVSHPSLTVLDLRENDFSPNLFDNCHISTEKNIKILH